MSQSAARRARRENGGKAQPTPQELAATIAGGKLLGQPEPETQFLGMISDMVGQIRIVAEPKKRECVMEFLMPGQIIRYRMQRNLTNTVRDMLGDALDAMDRADKEGEPLS